MSQRLRPDPASLLEVVIVNYNSTGHCLALLDSLEKSLGPGVRATVVDNASDDDPGRLAHKGPQVRFLANRENLGFGRAVNQALARRTRPYVLLLNPDCLLEDPEFARLLEYMETHPGVGVLGPRILDPDGGVQGSARSFHGLATFLAGRRGPLTRLWPNNPWSRRDVVTLTHRGREPREVDWVSGAAMLVRGEALDRVGGMDEDFFMYFEDTDWCRRMAKGGWKVVYHPGAQLTHQVGASCRSNPFRPVIEFHKSCYRYMKKYPPRGFGLTRYPALALLTLRCGVLLARRALAWEREVGPACGLETGALVPRPAGGRVAVVIVNYEAGPLLARALDCLANQTRRPDRVIVVDNMSSPESLAASRLPRPWVELVRPGLNLGFAAGNNLGVELAGDCEWIALLNPDAFPRPDWLERLMEGAARHPEGTFFAARLLSAGDTGLADGSGDAYHPSGLARRRDHGRPERECRREEGEVFGACAAAALYPAARFREAGGFDPEYFCYFEDVDLAFRLRLRGGRCVYLPRAVVEHVGSATTSYRSDFATYHGYRNLVTTYFKDMPGPLVLALLPPHLAAQAALVLVAGRRGQGPVALRALRDAWRALPRALKARRGVQAGRRVSCLALLRAMSWLP